MRDRRGRQHAKRVADVPREHVDPRTNKAKKKMSRRAAQALASRTGMNAYQCSYCGAWHVGRTKQQQDSGQRRF